MNYAIDHAAQHAIQDHPCDWGDLLHMIQTFGTAAIPACSLMIDATTDRYRNDPELRDEPMPNAYPAMRSLISLMDETPPRGSIASLDILLHAMAKDRTGETACMARDITRATWNARHHEETMARADRKARAARIAGTD